MNFDDVTCGFCHADDYEIVRSDTHGFIVLCNECGYARKATMQHLMAS